MQPIKKNNHWLLCQEDIKSSTEIAWFEQSFWLNQGRLLGANSGRGSAWIIKSEFGKWVLRHYFRGGLYAKLISKDSYLWTGIENTRAIKEFKLLQHLQDMHLPCPKPVAAKVTRKGLFYRNDLIMEHIKHEHTFTQYLTEINDDNGIWGRIGAVIKKFHNQGIYHADLNANNILLAGDDVFLIDFDKGKVRTPKTAWQQANLNRLKRSIEKETGKSCDHDLKDNWQQLLNAYHES